MDEFRIRTSSPITLRSLILIFAFVTWNGLAWSTDAYKHHISAIILLSGDCHPNPGPAKPVYKFPCGICEKPVKSNQRGVQCDDCDVWFHTKCMSMPSAVYKGIEGKDVSWICCSCGLPNFSSTLFFTPSSDSINTSIATENSYSVLSSLSGHHTGCPGP